jgi:hypothetical protein
MALTDDQSILLERSQRETHSKPQTQKIASHSKSDVAYRADTTQHFWDHTRSINTINLGETSIDHVLNRSRTLKLQVRMTETDGADGSRERNNGKKRIEHVYTKRIDRGQGCDERVEKSLQSGKVHIGISTTELKIASASRNRSESQKIVTIKLNQISSILIVFHQFINASRHRLIERSHRRETGNRNWQAQEGRCQAGGQGQAGGRHKIRDDAGILGDGRR